MHIFWALFDQDYLSPARSYWTWHHDELDVAMLDNFYYAIAHQHHPSRADRHGTELAQSDIADVNPDWKCWYQYLDGGRDSQGRPGRFVLLCGFIKREEFRQIAGSLAGLNRLPAIQGIRETAIQRPVPPPEDLSINILDEDLLQASDMNSTSLPGENESVLLANVIADTPLITLGASPNRAPFPLNDRSELASEGYNFPDTEPSQANVAQNTGDIGSSHRTQKTGARKSCRRSGVGKYSIAEYVTRPECLIACLLVVCVLAILVVPQWEPFSTIDRDPSATGVNPGDLVRLTPGSLASKAIVAERQTWPILDPYQFSSWQVGFPLATFVAGLLLGLTLNRVMVQVRAQRLVTRCPIR